ncbi:hypothetical protein D3C86_1107180 [compost metagenome]
MNSTTERPLFDTTSLTGEFWGMARTGLQTMFWAQEQADAFATAWLEQTRASRMEAQKLADSMLSQAKANHEALNRMVEGGVRDTMRWVPGGISFVER